MDAERAISLTLDHIRSGGLDYPVTELRADQFDGGWCVYAPSVLADGEQPDDEDVTRSVFMVGASGRVKEVTSTGPADQAREWFAEACLWFSAEEPGSRGSSLPSHPDFSQFAQPRAAADYDRETVDVLARALTHERDFAGWLADRLRELADLLGGTSRLVSRRPNSWAAGHLRELTEPHADDAQTEVWRTWPAPENLPDVDVSGWLLVPGARMVDILESLEAELPAAARLADVIAGHANQAPSWRACGVADLMPQLVALPRADLPDADVADLRRVAAEDEAEDQLDKLLIPPGDPDVDVLLRIAVDARQQGREVIDVDAAVTAVYRRVLDQLDAPFENYWYEAMFME